MVKILKNLYPTIRPYLCEANYFSMIDDKAFESGWVYDKYINLQYELDESRIRYSDISECQFGADERIFVRSYMIIPSEICSKNLLCKLIVEMIDNDEYFSGYWDENIIFSYLNNYQVDWVFHHNCFIYGYDSDDEIFYMQGYLTDGKWENIIVPFDLFYESVKSKIKCGAYEISGCKLISEYEWKFDFVKMKQQILDYVDMKKLKIDDNLIYNLDGCSLFFCRLNENIEIHIPSIYCMYEHMKIMVRRIRFLYDNDFMKCDDELIEMATILEKRYKLLLLLAIKYTTMQSKKILSKIKAGGLEAIDLEKKLMLYFCDMLDK